MPKAKTTKISKPVFRKKIYRKKNYRKKKFAIKKFESKKATMEFQNGRLPFPERAFYHVPYAHTAAITADGTPPLGGLTSTSGAQIYRLMGPYDPIVALGGGQPLQWDQIAFLYERYWVRMVKVSIVFTNPSHDGMMVGFRIRGSTDSTISTTGRSIEQITTMDNVRYKWINNTGSQIAKFVTFTLKPYEILGISKTQYANLEYSGLTQSSTPFPDVYLEPFAIHTVNDETATVRYLLKIEYFVECTNRQTTIDA